MPQIKHTSSVTIAHEGAAGAVNVEIPDSRYYTKFLIDAVHTNVTALAVEVNIGNGWRTLYASSMGGAQEVTLNLAGINMIKLETPAKAGVRLVVTDNDAGAEIPIRVTMTGSIYNEGRK